MSDHLTKDLTAYLRALRKNWLLIVVCTLLGLGVSVFLTVRTPPTYSSSVTFFVTSPEGSDTPLSGDQFGRQRVNSYAKLVTSDRLATMVKNVSGSPLSPQQVMGRLSAESDVNTVLLTVRATDGTRDGSLDLARAVSTQMVALVEQIESQGGQRRSPVALDVVSGPTTTPYPISPQKTKNLATGMLAGLLLGLVAAVARDLLDTSVRRTEALQDVSRRPVLASIPRSGKADDRGALVGGRAGVGWGEAFRKLRTSLQFMNVDEPPKVLVVTSANAAEGKTVTAVNLALSFGDSGARVLLVEADLRRPAASDALGLDRAIGLSNVLAGRVRLDDALQQFGQVLTVLPSGALPPNPAELLGSRAMAELLKQTRSRFDMVIIDSPPLLPVTDAAVLAARADGTVLVVRAGRTKRGQVANALRSLDGVGAAVLGTVLTMAAPGRRAETDYFATYETAAQVVPVTSDPGRSVL